LNSKPKKQTRTERIFTYEFERARASGRSLGLGPDAVAIRRSDLSHLADGAGFFVYGIDHRPSARRRADRIASGRLTSCSGRISAGWDEGRRAPGGAGAGPELRRTRINKINRRVGQYLSNPLCFNCG